MARAETRIFAFPSCVERKQTLFKVRSKKKFAKSIRMRICDKSDVRPAKKILGKLFPLESGKKTVGQIRNKVTFGMR